MTELVKQVNGDMESVEAAVRAALSQHGFGVLTEIDVAATLKAKLGVDRRPLKILGACNPTFANRALEIDPSVALLMPCNVVLEQNDDGILVSAMDPTIMMQDPGMKAIAEEATKLLSDTLKAL